MSNLDTSAEHQTSEIFFEPVVSLPVLTISNAEENETCLFKCRAKLYRFDRAEDPPEWKERGTGYVKILQHNETGQYRILMRRDRTLKVCANHLINSSTELRANCGSDKAFVWQTLADFADEVPKSESLGIRFPNVEVAKSFKKFFEKGQLTANDRDGVKLTCADKTVSDSGTNDISGQENETESELAEALKTLHVDQITSPEGQAQPTQTVPAINGPVPVATS